MAEGTTDRAATAQAKERGVETMRAVTVPRYGGPEVLRVAEIPAPTAGREEVLVRVHVASANPADWHRMTGLPLIARPAFGFPGPSRKVCGTDLAGTVAAVGEDVTSFSVGDEVFGTGPGTFADLVVTTPDRLARRPKGLGLEQAAALPVAGVTALQGLRDHARIQAGERVLVNGSSGGVGTFAVQVAKHLGAEVTAVCSTRNVELVADLGADHVIDYTSEDFTRGSTRYDVIFDVAGNRPPADCRRVMAAEGRIINVGGSKEGRWFGPLGQLVRTKLHFAGKSQTARSFTADETPRDLATLAEWAVAGHLAPVIGHRYRLDDAADALHLIGSGRARGKAIVAIR